MPTLCPNCMDILPVTRDDLKNNNGTITPVPDEHRLSTIIDGFQYCESPSHCASRRRNLLSENANYHPLI